MWKLRGSGFGLLDSSSVGGALVSGKQRLKDNDQQVSILNDLPPIPEFRIAIMHYGTIGLCLSLEQGEDVPRRFCDDIARAMAADLRSLKFNILEWPMLDTSGIDQSVRAARQVVTQRLITLPDKVIVIGAKIVEYFEPLENFREGDPLRLGKQTYQLVPSLTELLKSASKKRRLMSFIYNWH